MKTSILSVPRKKTEEVSWIKPLNNYLLSIYGNTSEYQDDLAILNKTREDLRGVSAENSGVQLYYRYYSQLELLDLRVAFASMNKHKKVCFEWFDAFQPSVSYKQYALPFEKAGILFNLGAILSEAATKKYRESENGADKDDLLKDSLLYLQQAAGVYQFLSENFLHAPSNDLGQPTVKYLVQLMLAQASEVFALKVISGDLDQSKNSLISKLCKGCSIHYEECVKLIKQGNGGSGKVSGDPHEFLDDDYDLDAKSDENDDGEIDGDDGALLDEDTVKIAQLDPSWPSMMKFKQLYYLSLAYYFQGLQLESTKKYGQSIAHLQKSVEILEEISQDTLRTISRGKAGSVYDLLDNYKYQKDAVAIKLSELERDNDYIYNEIIPSKTSLPEIKAMDAVKVIPITSNATFNSVNEHNYNNFFTNVVPVNIHELMSFYSEEKSQFLRNEIDQNDVANEELSSVLEWLKMPKSLVSLKEVINGGNFGSTESGESSKVSSTTLSKAKEIADSFNKDNSNKQQIKELRDQIFSIIQGSTGGSQDIIQLKTSFIEASNRDKNLYNLVQENFDLYTVLGKGINSAEFKGLFEVKQEKKPNEMSLLDIDDFKESSEESLNRRIKSIEDILHDLNIVRSDRGKLIESLKKQIHSDDISDILILNTRVKTTNEIKNIIFPEEMKKFRRYSTDLDKLVKQQKEFSARLETEWKVLSQDPQVREVQSSKRFKDELLRSQEAKIDQLYDGWKRYTVGLSKGVEFYRSLLQFGENTKKEKEDANALVGGLAGLEVNSHPKYGHAVQTPQSSHGSILQQNSYGSIPQQNSYSSIPQQHSYGTIPPQQSYGSQSRISNPQQQSYGQPTHSYGGATIFPTSNTNQPPQLPPQLPPKMPSFGIQGGQYGQNAQYSTPQSIPHVSQAPQVQQNFPEKTGQTSKPQSDLIYDQPSTYQPNMYNFFSNN